MTQPANDTFVGEFDELSEDDPLGVSFGPAQRRLWESLRATGHRKIFLRGVLGFDFNGSDFQSQPQRPFKPRGLMIWGAPDGAVVDQATVGQCLQVLQSVDGVPAKFFGFGKNYADLAKMVDAGVEPPAWCDWDTAFVGSVVRIRIRDRNGKPLGPKDGIELCMWGVAQV